MPRSQDYKRAIGHSRPHAARQTISLESKSQFAQFEKLWRHSNVLSAANRVQTHAKRSECDEQRANKTSGAENRAHTSNEKFHQVCVRVGAFCAQCGQLFAACKRFSSEWATPVQLLKMGNVFSILLYTHTPCFIIYFFLFVLFLKMNAS